MSPEELLTQVDEHDNVLSLKPRSEFNNGKLIHRSVYLLILNNKGEILLQKRPVSKKWHPGLYSFSITGSVGAETYDECMKRRIREDLGVSIPFQELFKFHHFDNVDKAFKTVYVANIKNDTFIQKSEQEFRWIAPDKLKEELEGDPEKFAPPFLTGMKIYFKQYRKTDL